MRQKPRGPGDRISAHLEVAEAVAEFAHQFCGVEVADPGRVFGGVGTLEGSWPGG